MCTRLDVRTKNHRQLAVSGPKERTMSKGPPLGSGQKDAY
jgi:hypothetical protein